MTNLRSFKKMLRLSPQFAMGGIVLLGALAPACSSEADLGSLVVPFRIGAGNSSCEDKGIDAVRVTLDEEAYIARADCDLGEVRVDDVEAGSYSLLVEALDNSGVAILDNQADSETDVEVFGGGQTTTADEAVLTATPAKLRLRWNLGFQNCEGASIDRFEIEAYDREGVNILLASEVDCESSSDEDGYRMIEDPNRSLDGARFGIVNIQPLDMGGVSIGDDVVVEFEPPGDGYSVSVSLVCDKTGCTSDNSE